MKDVPGRSLHVSVLCLAKLHDGIISPQPWSHFTCTSMGSGEVLEGIQ